MLIVLRSRKFNRKRSKHLHVAVAHKQNHSTTLPDHSYLFIKLIMKITLFITCFLAVSSAWAPPTSTRCSNVEPSITCRASPHAQQEHQNAVSPTAFLHVNADKVIMAVVVCGWTLGFSGGPALAADVASGKTIFDANCAACHAGGQNLVNAPRTLEKEAIESNLGSLDLDVVKSFVQNSASTCLVVCVYELHACSHATEIHVACRPTAILTPFLLTTAFSFSSSWRPFVWR